MFPWALFILYVCVLSFLIARLKKKESTLSWKHTTAAFLFKVTAGCAYGWVHLHYYNGDDTWLYNAESLDEYVKLTSDPLLFFVELWPPAYGSQGVSDYIFNNLERNLTVKLLAFFNFFSGGHYYTNVVFFNFLLFWGHYWLYTFLDERYSRSSLVLIVVVFFIPTIMFWLSGIRGDGIVLFFLALLFIRLQKYLHEKSFSSLAIAFFCMLALFIFRSAVLMALIPFLIGWGLCEQMRWKPLRTYLVTYIVAGLFFFFARYLHPALNLPQMVAERQQAFMELPGKTRFAMEPLTDNATSFIKAVPSALANTLVRPLPWEANGLLQLITSIETLVFLVLILFSLPFLNYQQLTSEKWLFGLFLFAVTLFMFIGLTIPFPGAIVRYKAIPQLLTLCIIAFTLRRIKK